MKKTRVNEGESEGEGPLPQDGGGGKGRARLPGEEHGSRRDFKLEDMGASLSTKKKRRKIEGGSSNNFASGSD